MSKQTNSYLNVTLNSRRFFPRHGYALGILFLVASGTFGFYLYFRPFGADNLISLSLGATPSIFTFFTNSLVNYLPIYRPISISTIWIQYHLVGVAPISYAIVNTVFWVGCSFLLYLLVHHYTKSRLVSILVAILMLVDIRSASALYWIIERQTPLTILFGVLAILTYYNMSQRGHVRKPTIISIVLLLLFSVLSKEYGLAFTGTFLVIALLSSAPKEMRTAIVIVLLVVVAYSLLRFVIARSNLDLAYCEKAIGYRDRTLSICYSDYSLIDQMKFYLWNVGSSFVGTFVPTLFSNTGQWVGFSAEYASRTTNIHFAFSVISICLVGLSVYKYPRKSIPLFALVVFNALLNFLLYRTRNQLVGIFGLYGLMGIGLFALWNIPGKSQTKRAIVNISLCIVLLFIAFKAAEFSNHLFVVTQSYYRDGPCEVIAEFPQKQAFNMEIVRQLKTYYGLKNQDCVP